MKRRTAAAVSVVLVLAAGGCSNPPQYTTPSSLCGIPVEAAVLKPLLVPGEELEQSAANTGPGISRCAVLVDKDRILAVQGEIIPDDQDPSVRRSWQVYGASKIDVGDHALVSDINAVSVAACTYHGASRKFVVEAERFYPQRDGAKGRREALTRFLTAYFPAALRAAGCAP